MGTMNRPKCLEVMKFAENTKLSPHTRQKLIEKFDEFGNILFTD